MVHYNKNERYIKYLCHFHYDQDFFECHEILEEQWKLELNHQYKKVWLGLIRLSVVLYHYRRRNFTGAKKLFRHVITFSNETSLLEMAGIDRFRFQQIILDLQLNLQNETEFHPFDLPINDQELIERFQNQKDNYSSFTEDLINKHSTRDRTDVISERLKQLELRKKI
ncbi:DUF309 domain-containing protein [Gottfriedia acidiceleris]|uniref:DUF309 domain-containing protein n=1 Tax=Gottfriedia acidiceleris TaxID=371036 RepID=A0ABY4JUB5_9BACI|nr:DUF309 domain-containing protein [Gottfriedia acidiceleris]UPM55910.1 DUF309 domain-containing protein [Gottfriedia acidiceleris]